MKVVYPFFSFFWFFLLFFFFSLHIFLLFEIQMGLGCMLQAHISPSLDPVLFKTFLFRNKWEDVCINRHCNIHWRHATFIQKMRVLNFLYIFSAKKKNAIAYMAYVIWSMSIKSFFYIKYQNTHFCNVRTLPSIVETDSVHDR